MVSETAIASIDELHARGLDPSPRDVIRLNALGLQLEAVRAKRVASSTYLLPRVAQVSPELWFRQPAIGHEIWLDKVERNLARGDMDSRLALTAFALSRDVSALPDPDSPEAVSSAMDEFAAKCASYTRDQLYQAIDYALHGFNPAEGEVPAAKPDNGSSDGDDADWMECVAIGVLNEGRAVLWGATEADLKRMTKRQLADVIQSAKAYHGMALDTDEDFYQGRYYATLDEIAARLESERKSPDGRSDVMV